MQIETNSPSDMGLDTRCRKLNAQNINSVSCTGRFAGHAYVRPPIRSKELCGKKDCCGRSKFNVSGRRGAHLKYKDCDESADELRDFENLDDESQNEGARMALSLATDLYRKAMRSAPAADHDTSSDRMLNALLESALVDASPTAKSVAAVAYANAPLSAIEQEEIAAKRMMAKLAREQAQLRSQLRARTPPRSSPTHAAPVAARKLQMNANGKTVRPGHDQDLENSEDVRKSEAVGLTKSCPSRPRSSTQASKKWGHQIRNYVQGGCICQ